MRIRAVFYFLIFFLFSVQSYSNHRVVAKEEIDLDEYRGRITRMVGFLEHLFNTVGSEKTKASEKKEVINFSYLKVFDSPGVQIEDDLDQDRKVLINKNVQAYLKDIDFFYRNVKFDFEVQEITVNTNSENKQFFRVKTIRKLNGVSQDGMRVDNNQERFIEINLNEANEDLKIASIYTTKLTSEEVMNKWWAANSFEWKVIFKRAIMEEGTPSFEQLKQIKQLEALDISYNKYIVDFSPLRMLNNLKTLNLNSTKIKDLKDIRNLQQLKKLDISNTAVASINELAYLKNLEVLLIENTPISSLEPLYKMPYLSKLYCKNTKVQGVDINALKRANPNLEINYDVEINTTSWWAEVTDTWKEIFNQKVAFAGAEPSSSELANIENIEELDLAGNEGLRTLNSIQFVKGLRKLDISGTNVTDISALTQLTNLEYLDVSENWITDITPLYQLENLKFLNIDNIQATSEDIEQYVATHPETKVIYKANEHTIWFLNLSPAWKEVLLQQAGYNKDQVLKTNQIFDIFYIKKINIIGRNDIESLDPLSNLLQLEELYFANTMKINDLTPLSNLNSIKVIDCSFNPITDLGPLENLGNLKSLNVSNTYVSSLDALQRLYSLEKLHMSSSRVNDLKDVRNLTNLKEIKLSNTDVKSLSPLITLLDLENIECYNTKISAKDIQKFREIRPEVEITHY